MGDIENKDKVKLVLALYSKLSDGYVIHSRRETAKYGINERSIQRDIDDIRNYLADDADRIGFRNDVVYDRERKGYRLKQICNLKIDNSEILAVCKILLERRSISKNEMKELLHKLVDNCVPESNHTQVDELICDEVYRCIN